VNKDNFLAAAMKMPNLRSHLPFDRPRPERRATRERSPKMSTAYLLPLTLAHMAYCAWYWTALTVRMIGEARHDRVKRHLDWTRTSPRRLSQSESWRFW
jgi:hypothetical protein